MLFVPVTAPALGRASAGTQPQRNPSSTGPHTHCSSEPQQGSGTRAGASYPCGLGLEATRDPPGLPEHCTTHNQGLRLRFTADETTLSPS